MSNVQVHSKTVKMFKSVIHVIVMTLSTATLYASPYTFENSHEMSTVLSSMGLFLIGSKAEQSKESVTSDKLSQLDDDKIPYFDRPYAGQWDPHAEWWWALPWMGPIEAENWSQTHHSREENHRDSV